MTHGLNILTALREEMKRLGRKPSEVESVAIIDDYLKANAVKLKRVRKANQPKPRKRDEVFDALAALDGVVDTRQLTRHGAAKIAEAKKQILDVMPDATTEQVIQEIRHRWEKWCRRFPDKRMQTVMALVKHWGELGGGRPTQVEQQDNSVYVAPAFDWREALKQKYPGTFLVEDIGGKEWGDVPIDIRQQLVREYGQQRVSA